VGLRQLVEREQQHAHPVEWLFHKRIDLLQAWNPQKTK